MALNVLETGNEHQRKFELGQTISVRQKDYDDSTQALSSPVASKIFGFPWAEQVTVGPDFVSVTKQDWVDWSVLEEPLKGLLEEHFSSLTGDIEENPEIATQASGQLDSGEAKTIQALIEDQINPALASHGGYVVLHSVEQNKVFLEMGGGCQGCAMSYQTLKEGIEGAIKDAVPSIQAVVDVTDHNQGDNPFYKK